VAYPGGFDLDLRLELAAGEVVALLGPNGAGKSTALRTLAGLLPLDDGRLSQGGSAWDDPARGVFVPPHRRSVGVVFQDYLLFPHLSTLDNVAFGLRCRGASKRAARTTAETWLRRVGLAGHAARKPAALSGGQAQRVALARALAVEPELLLLDEPLAALDAETRIEVRSDLRHHLAAFPGCALVVTHDPLDAMLLADRLVVLEAGRLVQQGGPAEVARRPRTRYVAKLVGLNLLHGESRGGTVRLGNGETVHAVEPSAHDGEVLIAFRPAAVSVYRDAPYGSPRNVWPATVTSVDPYGGSVRVTVTGPVALTAEVSTAAVADLSLAPGAAVHVSVKAAEIDVYPA
jgi:molybdate transport system ATP-binding protein